MYMCIYMNFWAPWGFLGKKKDHTGRIPCPGKSAQLHRSTLENREGITI